MSDTVQFSDLDGVDRVTLTTNLNRELAAVSDPDRIAGLVSWLVEREDGWEVPADTPRVMKLRLNFSAGGRSKGSLGVGSRYLTAQRRGGFYQRDAQPGDRAEIFGLLGIDDPGA